MLHSLIGYTNLAEQTRNGRKQSLPELHALILYVRHVGNTGHPCKLLRYSSGKVRDRAVTCLSLAASEGRECRNSGRSRTALSLWLLAALLPSLVLAAPPTITPDDIQAALQSIPAYAPDRILVRFKPGTPADRFAKGICTRVIHSFRTRDIDARVQTMQISE